MSLQTILVLGIAFFLSLLAVIRTYAGRRWVSLLVLFTPVLYFSIRWARHRDAWPELALGAVLAVMGILVWWFTYGRTLDPPAESNIRVWTEDDPF